MPFATGTGIGTGALFVSDAGRCQAACLGFSCLADGAVQRTRRRIMACTRPWQIFWRRLSTTMRLAPFAANCQSLFSPLFRESGLPAAIK
jgi:hypothetical protein